MPKMVESAKGPVEAKLTVGEAVGVCAAATGVAAADDDVFDLFPVEYLIRSKHFSI